MAFLKKNKEEDFDDEEDLDEERSGKKGTYQKKLVSKKDFKDLKKENRKKRKEPKKPWGRKERFFVLFLLLLTAGVSGVLALSARSWKLPGFPRLAIPKITIPQFLAEETIVIEGRREDEKKAVRIISSFKEATESLSGAWGLYVIRLDNGYAYGVNEDETFQAASLIKLPVMAAMYLEEEKGALNLDEKYYLKNTDKVRGSGSLYQKPAGYVIGYAELLRLMGKESDNTAYHISVNHLGQGKVDQVMADLGMTRTSLEENETTPEEIGNFFSDLWNGNMLNEVNRDRFIESLTDTIYEQYLASGVKDGWKIAHKYGREVHVINDAGIIFPEEDHSFNEVSDHTPFIVVIMSKGVVEKEAEKAFPLLSKQVIGMEIGND